MNLIYYFLPAFYLNAILIYFILYLLIEAFIKISKVHSPSWQLFLRSLPICKLLIEPFQYSFANWALVQKITFFNQTLNSRELEAGLSASLKSIYLWVSLSLKETPIKFTLLDPLFERLGFWFVFSIFSMIVLLVLIKSSCWLFAFLKEIRFQEENALEYSLQKLPFDLQKKLALKKVKVLISQREHFSPYIFFVKQRKIVFPKNSLQLLSKEEYNAVIEHELAHLNQPHLYLFIFLQLIQNIFFFAKLKKMRLSLEKWCDKKAVKEGADPLSLMKAIQKFAYLNHKRQVYNPHFAPASMVIERIKALSSPKKATKVHSSLYLMVSFLFILITFFSTIGHF